MGLPIETIFLVFQGSITLEVALERQTEELRKQKEEITASLELCQKVLKDTKLETINVDTYLDFVTMEEEKGNHFIEIQEIIDDFTEYTAVAGAIPGMLGSVVLKGATEVRTSGCGGRENAYCRFKSVDSKLWAQNGARWIENGGVWIVFDLHKVAENIGGDHSVCHAPLVKACRNEHVGCGL